MANKTDGKQTGLMHRIFKDFDGWDFLSGALGLGGIVGGYMGTHPSKSPDDKTPPPIAPKQRDEGNLAFLLAVLAEGDVSDVIRSEQLSELHNALVVIHPDYAEQFRNYFFSISGINSEDMIKQLEKLMRALLKENDGANRAIMIAQSSNIALVLALKLCRRIEAEIDKLHPSQMSREEATKKTIELVAREMATDRQELPGNITTHTEEQLRKLTQGIDGPINAWTRNLDERQIAKEAQVDPLNRIFKRIFRFDIPQSVQIILIALLCAGIIFFVQQFKHF